MSQLGVSISIKDLFFDRQKVINATDKASRRALVKAGAFVRTSARSSIKPRSYAVSAPAGRPPYDHTSFNRRRANRQRKKQGLAARRASIGEQGLRAILFGYDDKSKSVVIGPVRFNGKKSAAIATATQEYGGVASRFGKRIQVKPHPYMRPALQRELPNLPKRWRGAVK